MIDTPLQRAGTNWIALSLGALISPEQCRNAAKVDEKADVYSFGVMLYQPERSVADAAGAFPQAG